MKKAITVSAPRLTINLTHLLTPLFQPEASLVPTRKPVDTRITRRRAASPAAVPEVIASRMKAPEKLERIEQSNVRVPRVSGFLSRMANTYHLKEQGIAELELPIGMGQVISARALKRMLKAEDDILLRKAGDSWDIVEDKEPIDLGDPTVEFRIGPLQVYS